MKTYLNNIVKISKENYDILTAGGIVNGHTYSPESLYLVEQDFDRYITDTEL